MGQTLFHLTPEVCPGHDLLAGITALLETDAAQGFPIDHLGQQGILVGRSEPGQAGANVLQAPGGITDRVSRGAEPGENGFGAIQGQAEQ